MNRRERCKLDGDYFEGIFKNRVERRGYHWVKSTEYEDIHKHIDCYVNGKGVDVKGNRHLDTIWLEYKNVLGKNGWLLGEADLIAFHISEMDMFSLFYRKDLLDFVCKNVNIAEVTEDKSHHLKAYSRSRFGRNDLLIKVKFETIKHLEKGRL